jgi:hypothetical protein
MRYIFLKTMNRHWNSIRSFERQRHAERRYYTRSEDTHRQIRDRLESSSSGEIFNLGIGACILLLPLTLLYPPLGIPLCVTAVLIGDFYCCFQD